MSCVTSPGDALVADTLLRRHTGPPTLEPDPVACRSRRPPVPSPPPPASPVVVEGRETSRTTDPTHQRDLGDEVVDTGTESPSVRVDVRGGQTPVGDTPGTLRLVQDVVTGHGTIHSPSRIPVPPSLLSPPVSPGGRSGSSGRNG